MFPKQIRHLEVGVTSWSFTLFWARTQGSKSVSVWKTSFLGQLDGTTLTHSGPQGSERSILRKEREQYGVQFPTREETWELQWSLKQQVWPKAGACIALLRP